MSAAVEEKEIDARLRPDESVPVRRQRRRGGAADEGSAAEGRSAQEVLNEDLIAGMSVVGEDFKHNVLYVPEVLIAARAMKAGMAVLKPLLTSKDSGTKPKGVLLMGTVRGDLHDIGKNLVGMMAEGAGFEVHDIGVDQSVESSWPRPKNASRTSSA
jgi:methanogenic corrinoid protein MtbC1